MRVLLKSEICITIIVISMFFACVQGAYIDSNAAPVIEKSQNEQ